MEEANGNKRLPPNVTDMSHSCQQLTPWVSLTQCSSNSSAYPLIVSFKTINTTTWAHDTLCINMTSEAARMGRSHVTGPNSGWQSAVFGEPIVLSRYHMYMTLIPKGSKTVLKVWAKVHRNAALLAGHAINLAQSSFDGCGQCCSIVLHKALKKAGRTKLPTSVRHGVSTQFYSSEYDHAN